MAKDIDFKYSSAGFIEIMKSPGVAADLERRANAVRSAVQARYQRPGWDIISNVQIGRTRARAIVSGVPERDERAHRIMGSALDAAR